MSGKWLIASLFFLMALGGPILTGPQSGFWKSVVRHKVHNYWGFWNDDLEEEVWPEDVWPEDVSRKVESVIERKTTSQWRCKAMIPNIVVSGWARRCEAMILRIQSNDKMPCRGNRTWFIARLAIVFFLISYLCSEDRAHAFQVFQIVQPARPAWSDEQFEKWAFQDWAFNPNGNAETCRKRFDALLQLKIEEIDRTCHLTEEQKKKLHLIGCGDIHQIYNSFEMAKHQFELLGNDTRKLQEVAPLVRPVQQAHKKLCQEGSLFSKSLRHILTPEQVKLYEAMERERLEFLHRAHVELAVHTIEESIPLREAQRNLLIAILLKEVKPARPGSEHGFNILMMRISLLPEEKIKPLLSATQWNTWDKRMLAYRKEILDWRRAGILSAEEDIDDPPERAK